MFRHLFGALRRAHRRPCAPRRARPQLEVLEGKVLPSATALPTPGRLLDSAIPVQTAAVHLPAGLARFNGHYKVAFAGTLTTAPGMPAEHVNGSVYLRVANGLISADFAHGKGHVTRTGVLVDTASFQGATISLRGQVKLVHGAITVAGTWSGTFQGHAAHGTWHASRVGP